MSDQSLSLQTAALIQKQFDLQTQQLLTECDEQELLDRLHGFLADRIIELMNSNFEFLMQTLYRLDISEESVKEIFRQTDERSIAGRLATLIIQRQRQKAETRLNYGNIGEFDLG